MIPAMVANCMSQALRSAFPPLSRDHTLPQLRIDQGHRTQKAKLIVEHFGEQTLAIVEQQPERLSEVKGISAKDRDQISKTWAEQSEIKELHLFLQSHDVSMNVATRVYKQYGKDSIKVIRENPYQLAQEVHGIGFRTADDIAVKLGMPPDSVPRLATGLKYVLAQAANEDGHCFLREKDLLRRASDILKAPTEALAVAMEQLNSDQDVFIEASSSLPGLATARLLPIDDDAPPLDWSEIEEPQSHIYFGPFWYAESGSARLLRLLMRNRSSLPPTTQQQWIPCSPCSNRSATCTWPISSAKLCKWHMVRRSVS